MAAEYRPPEKGRDLVDFFRQSPLAAVGTDDEQIDLERHRPDLEASVEIVDPWLS